MNQEVVEGYGSIRRLPEILGKNGVSHVFLVCGKSFLAQPVWNDLRQSPIPMTVFTGFSSNPTYDEVRMGVALFREEKCDCIVAIGGGSAIDVAKCVKLFSPLDEADGLLFNKGHQKNPVLFVAAPTTSGTGSESTHFAVMYYKGVKQSVADPGMLPKIVFLDPSFLETLPLYQKKCTMLDALCQAIESWWSVRSTQESVADSEKAIPLILRNYDQYLMNDAEANEAMLTASNLAGKAINITTTTAPHAMSYKLTSLFHIPHGHAVAICLPVVWEYMLGNVSDCVDGRGCAFVQKSFQEIAEAMGATTPEDAIGIFKGVLKHLDIHAPECHDPKIIAELVSSVNPQRLENNPVRLNQNILLKMYQKILRKIV